MFLDHPTLTKPYETIPECKRLRGQLIDVCMQVQ